MNTKQINNSKVKALSDDPRIDSPEIKVVYDTEKRSIVDGRPVSLEEPTTTENPPKQCNCEYRCECQRKDHECKVDMKDAIKQNLIGFIAAAIALLSFGFLVGNRRN